MAEENISEAVSKVDDILGNGTLTKKILEHGSGQRPSMGSLVHVSYDVYPFHDDENIDLTGTPSFHANISFYLGDGGVKLNALELGVALMNVGEKAVIKCTNSKLAYEMEPPEFRPENISPDSKLCIVTELLNDEGIPPPWNERPAEERIGHANEKVEAGNAYCRANIFAQAINSYSNALKAVGYNDEVDDNSVEDFTDAETIRFKAYSGLSTAHFNSLSFDNAIKCCDDALKRNPKAIKIIFRKGRAYAQLNRFEEARKEMAYAKELAGEDSAGLSPDYLKFVDNELRKVAVQIKKEKKKEAELYKKMIPVKPIAPRKKPSHSYLAFSVIVVGVISCVCYYLFKLS